MQRYYVEKKWQTLPQKKTLKKQAKQNKKTRQWNKISYCKQNIITKAITDVKKQQKSD